MLLTLTLEIKGNPELEMEAAFEQVYQALDCLAMGERDFSLLDSDGTVIGHAMFEETE